MRVPIHAKRSPEDLFQKVLPENLFGRTGGGDSPAREENQAVAEEGLEVDVMIRRQHRDPVLAGEVTGQLVDLALERQIETGHRFIEEEDPGLLG